jgi:hypothetical protein
MASNSYSASIQSIHFIFFHFSPSLTNWLDPPAPASPQWQQGGSRGPAVSFSIIIIIARSRDHHSLIDRHPVRPDYNQKFKINSFVSLFIIE